MEQIGQTQPTGASMTHHSGVTVPLMDIGATVRIWADQVWHIGVIGILALLIGL